MKNNQDKIACIFRFLQAIAQNNNREWFNAHRADYDEAAADFADIMGQLLEQLKVGIPELAEVTVPQTLYRFYRDTRFSPDKSPYKRHFGAFMNGKGRKSIHGGYYFHLQPGGSLVAGGGHCYPPEVLKAIRNSIFNEVERYESIIKAPVFAQRFPVIGTERLKTCPKDFPKDWPHVDVIRPKNYTVGISHTDDFFLQKDWMDVVVDDYLQMKPFIDFVNETVDDYI